MLTAEVVSRGMLAGMEKMISEVGFAATDTDDIVEVLYLEDDPDVAELYRLKLEMDGYHVCQRRLDGGASAPIASPLPDLLFVDGGVKIAGALAALAGWRRDPRLHDIPAVILTSLRPADLESQGIHLGDLDQVLSQPEPQAVPWTA